MKVLVCRNEILDGMFKQSFEVHDVPKDFLTFAYEKIGCDLVDVVYIDNNVTMWVDDEGLLKSDNAVLEYTNNITLAGNIVFTGGADSVGNNLYLDDAEIHKLKVMCRNAELKGITR